MRAPLILAAATLAAAALPASPAAAGDRDRGFTALPSVSINSGFGDRFRHDRRGLRGTDTVMIYDREYSGDTAWRSDSFNDWWHERPERSYPAWMRRNQDCQRTWWDGSVLRC